MGTSRVGGSDTPEIAEAVEARYIKHVTEGSLKGAFGTLLFLAAALVGVTLLAVACAHWLWRLIAVVWGAT